MKKPVSTDTLATWWIAEDSTDQKLVLGPFVTRDLALRIRELYESVMKPKTYWIVEKTQPTQSLKWSEVCELLIKNGVELSTEAMDELEQIIKKGE